MWREEGREWEGWKKSRRGETKTGEQGLDMGGLRESPRAVRALGRGGCPQHGKMERREEEKRGRCCEGGGGGRRREEKDCNQHRSSSARGSVQVDIASGCSCIMVMVIRGCS